MTRVLFLFLLGPLFINADLYAQDRSSDDHDQDITFGISYTNSFDNYQVAKGSSENAYESKVSAFRFFLENDYAGIALSYLCNDIELEDRDDFFNEKEINMNGISFDIYFPIKLGALQTDVGGFYSFLSHSSDIEKVELTSGSNNVIGLFISPSIRLGGLALGVRWELGRRNATYALEEIEGNENDLAGLIQDLFGNRKVETYTGTFEIKSYEHLSFFMAFYF